MVASAIIEELKHYIAMVKGEFKPTKESLANAKSKKEASVMVTMKACDQMEDHNNHLCEQEVLLQTLVTKMESCPNEDKKTCNDKLKRKRVLLFYSRVLQMQESLLMKI
jgi:hypothetical protein